jgi:hypothetical protein
MRAKDLQGFGPVGTNGPTDTPAEVAEVADAFTRMDALLDPARGLLTVPDHSATVQACRADLSTIHAYIVSLERQLAEAREDAADWMHDCKAAESQLAAQRERDGRDAERYRFLHDDPPVELAVRQRKDYGARDGFSYLYLDGEQLDAAIDAALKGRP